MLLTRHSDQVIGMHKSNTVIPLRHKPGSYAWRHQRGLLGWADHIRVYRAIRAPRGPYPVPMKNDLLPGVVELPGRGL